MENYKNRKQSRSGVIAKKIDVDSIYNQMIRALDERRRLQEEQKALWRVIKSNHCNKSSQMNAIDAKIGYSTHKLNKLISELCNYKKTHRAMNLAHDYITKELNRINKIINSKIELVRDVNAGRACLISSTGRTHTSTISQENYIRIKREQARKLENWKKAIERYMV